MSTALLACGHQGLDHEEHTRRCTVAARVDLDRLRGKDTDPGAIHRATIRWDAVGAGGFVATVRYIVGDLAADVAKGKPRDIGARLYDVWRLGAAMGCREASDAMEAAGAFPVRRERVWPALRAFVGALGWSLSDAGVVSTSVDVEAGLVYRRMASFSVDAPWWAKAPDADALTAFARVEARAQADLSLGGGSRG